MSIPVRISAEVALEEACAAAAFYKQRCLVLRQVLTDTEAARAALEKERDDLLARLTAKEPKTADPLPKTKGKT